MDKGFCYNCGTQIIPRVIAGASPRGVIVDDPAPAALPSPLRPPAPLPLDDAERKALPILTFLCEYFPDAIVELTRLCVQGNIQHNPELAPTDIKWAREKSADQLDTAFRHLFERKLGIIKDADGQYHSIKAAWRNLAQAQLDIEADRK
jgi:hypothetical protein